MILLLVGIKPNSARSSLGLSEAELAVADQSGRGGGAQEFTVLYAGEASVVLVTLILASRQSV
jgi:hypothetical protein